MRLRVFLSMAADWLRMLPVAVYQDVRYYKTRRGEF